MTAIARGSIIPWRGLVWRAHKKIYAATDVGGALRYSARYSQAPDLFPAGPTWPALYCGLTYGVSLAEILRHLTPSTLPSLKNQRLSEILVGALEPSIKAWGIHELFAGLIVLPILGNVAENVVGVRLALQNRMDFSLVISAGSSLQVVLLVAPVLVLLSHVVGTPMDGSIGLVALPKPM